MDLHADVQDLADAFEENFSEASADRLYIFALFLQYCHDHGSFDVVKTVFKAFVKMFDFANQDIHAVVGSRGLDELQTQLVLKSFYSTQGVVQKVASSNSALFASDVSANLFAVFGGNPGTTSHLDKARWMADVYGPLIGDFVEQMSDFMQAESRDKRLVRAYPKGLCVYRWINNTLAVPDDQYLISSPVSIPLVGLVQLMQFMVLYKTLGISPGELARRFDVATGHSQGITSAVLLSTLTDDEDSFVSGSKKALGLWMLIGAFPQLAFPYYQVVYHGSEGLATEVEYAQPTPMVSIQGLARSQLTQIIVDFNSRDNGHVQLAVANTVDRFVVAGQLEHAAKFARYAKSLSAAPGEDQSKLPLALRKPVINVDFLGITAPYHCDSLKGPVEDMLAIAQEKGWSFNLSGMHIPVRSCDDGHDIR
ncbi:fatty acid synthase alpha subunit Lsd1, partial [Coemansia sp. RSA 1286]